VPDNEIKKIVDSPKIRNFTPDETDEVLKNTKNKKAVGLDTEIKLEYTLAFNEILLSLCNSV